MKMKAESMYKAEKDRLHNFSREENEALTKTGPGTLMGNLFRQYWIPVTPAADLQEPGGRQIRVKLLGEDLVLFRTRNGKVGLIGAYCSHRLGPLFFGRVEDDGLRCPYHGWKFAPRENAWRCRTYRLNNNSPTKSITPVTLASSMAALSGLIWERRRRSHFYRISNFSGSPMRIATTGYFFRSAITFK